MKSHFTFSKEQRNGIFLLILVIIGLQSLYFFIEFSPEVPEANREMLLKFEAELDSLRLLKLEDKKIKIYPFNPNYIDDYKGMSLGMTNEQIDRLLAFKKENKWINSSKQFQEVTKISDSLLNIISPYFKFPEWIANSKYSRNNIKYLNQNRLKSFSQKKDLNTATLKQLQRVNGIGSVLSKRIVRYRDTFKGGFIADVQLEDIYGLEPEVIDRVKNEFTVKTPRAVKKIDLNKASVDDLVTINHIDYDIAYNIIEERQLREGFKSISELTKVKDFPLNKIKIIELYLQLEKEN